MTNLFPLLGALLGAYVVYGAARGELYAKAGPWGALVRRDEEPFRFWSTLVVYGGLTFALFFVF